MGKTIEQFKAELIAKGMLVAAERLVIPKGTVPAPKPQPRAVSETNPTPDGMMRVFCAKTSCHEFTLQPKGQGQRWICPNHQGEIAPLLYYKGHLYTPHTINDEGVAFDLRNGRTITLEPSKVQWSRRPQ